MSSAYLRLLVFLPAILIPACASSSLAFLMMYSAYKLNKQSDNIKPWCTPFPSWNWFIVPCPVLTAASWPAYRFLRRQVRCLVSPSLQEFSTVCCDPHSQSLWHSQYSRSRFFFWNSLAFSIIQRMLAIWSLVSLPFLNPAWTSGSLWFTYYWSLACRILSITLLVCAAAAKSLQSCPTLCDPIDSSPPGSPIPRILQARTLEWVAISFSNESKWKVKVKSLNRVRLLATPWTAAYQAPPSMGFSRQEYWSGVPLSSPTSVWDGCNCVVVWAFFGIAFLWDWNKN